MSEVAAPHRTHRLRWLVIAIIAVAVLAAGALGVAIVMVENDQDAGQAALKATTVDAGSLAARVPFEAVAGHVVIDVGLGDGVETVPLILDSGAPVTFSDELADLRAGEPVGRLATAAIDGSVIRVDVVPVEIVTVGDAEFRDVGAVGSFIGLDNPLSCISPNGLIGANLMRAAVWQIDYDAGEVTIAASTDELDHIDGAIRIPFEPASEASPSPIIEISAGDDTLRFLIDTGSDGWLTISAADAEAAGIGVGPDAPSYSVEAAGAAGTYLAEIAYTSTDLMFGERLLPNVPIATLDTLADGQGNIGNAFLENFVVTFDWDDSYLYLDPIVDEISPDVPASAGITWDGEIIRVGSLVAGSDAESAGVVLGAPVVAVDGVDVSAATRDDFCDVLRAQVAGQPFDLTVGGEAPGDHRIEPVTDFFVTLDG